MGNRYARGRFGGRVRELPEARAARLAGVGFIAALQLGWIVGTVVDVPVRQWQGVLAARLLPGCIIVCVPEIRGPGTFRGKARGSPRRRVGQPLDARPGSLQLVDGVAAFELGVVAVCIAVGIEFTVTEVPPD